MQQLLLNNFLFVCKKIHRKHAVNTDISKFKGVELYHNSYSSRLLSNCNIYTRQFNFNIVLNICTYILRQLGSYLV